MGRLQEAIRALTTAISINSHDAVALAHRGFDYRDLGQKLRAIEDLDAAIRLHPTDEVAQAARGAILAKGDEETLIDPP